MRPPEGADLPHNEGRTCPIDIQDGASGRRESTVKKCHCGSGGSDSCGGCDGLGDDDECCVGSRHTDSADVLEGASAKAALPRIIDFEGEIWASPVRAIAGREFACVPGACYVPWGPTVANPEPLIEQPRHVFATPAGLCCKPNKVRAKRSRPQPSRNKFNDSIVEIDVSVVFEYEWIAWNEDKNCIVEWWEASNDNAPSGYNPPFKLGEWNPSHTNEQRGRDNAKEQQAKQNTDRDEEKGGILPKPATIEADDRPWSGKAQRGTSLDVFVRASSPCGVCCAYMRYIYVEDQDIFVYLLDESCSACNAVGPVGGKFNRPTHGSLPWTVTGSSQVGYGRT